jgi:hypothetical protein
MANNLKKFDPSRIEKGATVVLIGKRTTGISFIVRDPSYYVRGQQINHKRKIL